MAKVFMNDPIRILVKRDELTLEGIKQFFVVVVVVLVVVVVVVMVVGGGGGGGVRSMP